MILMQSQVGRAPSFDTWAKWGPRRGGWGGRTRDSNPGIKTPILVPFTLPLGGFDAGTETCRQQPWREELRPQADLHPSHHSLSENNGPVGIPGAQGLLKGLPDCHVGCLERQPITGGFRQRSNGYSARTPWRS